MAEHDRPVPTRLVHPMGMRVLVREIPPDQRTRGGLILPKTVEPRGADALYGEVIGVARATTDDPGEGANVSGVPDGSYVLFAPDAGFRVPWDDALRLVETKDVLAVVEEISPDRAH